MKLEEVKRCLNKPVRYETAGGDREYLLTGCILRKNDKGYFYQAELQDTSNKNQAVGGGEGQAQRVADGTCPTHDS